MRSRPEIRRGREAIPEPDPPHRRAAGLRPDGGSREEAGCRARIQSRGQTEDRRWHLREHRTGAVAHAAARAHEQPGDLARHRRQPGHRRRPHRDGTQHEDSRAGGRDEQPNDAARSIAQDGARGQTRKTRREKAILAISCRALSKRFGDVVAVAGVDLTVGAGECFGLLGPNGAGKTTTIEILEGLTPPDSGDVEILGMRWQDGAPGRALRERLGIQLQETQLADKLTVSEVLGLFRSFYRQSHTVEEVLALVELEEKRKARVVTLSGGQKQRLAVACALVSKPELLFLDEPTTGLDPQSRRQLWEIIRRFRADGGTVLLTTHYMEEAERLCDRVAIMDHGKIIAQGTPKELIASLGADHVVDFALTEGGIANDLVEVLQQMGGVSAVRTGPDGVSLTVVELHRALPALLALLKDRGVELSLLTTHHASLDDVFVALTGRQLRDT